MKHNEFANKKTVAARAAQLAIGIGAAVLVAAVPQFALAETSATSVDLQAVSITPASLSSDGQEQGVVRIAFADARGVTANQVVFQVLAESGAVLQQIDDQGTFAPRVTISHTFQVPGVQADDVVQVAAVTYADGAVWLAPGARVESPDQESIRGMGRAFTPSADASLRLSSQVLRESAI
jgi:hypothetical protein